MSGQSSDDHAAGLGRRRDVVAAQRAILSDPALTERYPTELVAQMDADDAFREAFGRLTPGRNRGCLLDVSACGGPSGS
jgi:uncharacterized protein YdeI (YjbR/CyaY-like superfamily)